MAEVAEKAELSKKTVSRVVTGTGHVSPKTRDRVLQIMEELDYHPNASARSLSSRKTRTVGIAIYRIEYVREDYFAALIAGMEEVLGLYDYDLLFTTTHKTSKLGQNLFFLRKVKEKRLDGLVIADKVVDIEDIRVLQRTETPFVVVDGSFPGLDVNRVLADYRTGMFELTEHLIRLGHSRIGFLHASSSWYTTLAQLQGYQLALEKNSLSYARELVREVLSHTEEATRQSVAAQTCELVSCHPMPTAVAVYDDLQVPIVFDVMRRKKLRVPEDVAVVGFYDFRVARQVYPHLTTVKVPLVEMGTKAAEKLISLIDGKHSEQHEIMLGTELVIRGSCGSRPGNGG